MFSLFFAALALMFSVTGCARYDELVEKDQIAAQKWADLEANLQRRYDLIPNLVETTKEYIRHERETLEAVIQARNQAQAAARAAADHPEDGAAVAKLGAAEGVLGAALGRFFALAEAYPDLKANQTIQQLMEELSSTENKIAFARQHFNDSVMAYNNQREQFPNSIVAGIFNFDEARQLEIEDETARKAVKVDFGKAGA